MQVRQPRLIAGIIFGVGLAAPLAARAEEAEAIRVDEIVVTASRLDTARAQIQPQLGASVYTLDAKAIAAIPGGDNVGLNQVVLQSPGVAQDSFGQLHVRGEHNGLQFRLNGVILPEGLSVFSQTLNPRLADKVQLITGALPAQYGLRTAGIVDITTKSGVYAKGGDVSVYGGSHGEVEPSFQVSGSSGPINAFVSGSYRQSDLGVESPNSASTPLHDRTRQFQGFAYVEDILDPSTRVSVIVGTSNQTFQIPDRAGLTPRYGRVDHRNLVRFKRCCQRAGIQRVRRTHIDHHAAGPQMCHQSRRVLSSGDDRMHHPAVG